MLLWYTSKHHSHVLCLVLQNLALSKDAKTSHAYRDEVDTYKEKALRVDSLEKEVSKLKEKLNEFDFYKTRVEVGKKARHYKR